MTDDVFQMAEDQEMTGYLRQGILLGTLMKGGTDVMPVFVEGSRNYTPDKLTVRVPHPTKDDITLVYTIVTESVVEE